MIYSWIKQRFFQRAHIINYQNLSNCIYVFLPRIRGRSFDSTKSDKMEWTQHPNAWNEIAKAMKHAICYYIYSFDFIEILIRIRVTGHVALLHFEISRQVVDLVRFIASALYFFRRSDSTAYTLHISSNYISSREYRPCIYFTFFQLFAILRNAFLPHRRFSWPIHSTSIFCGVILPLYIDDVH